MKILWLCNLVLPEFADEFGVPKSNFGGWMTGMLSRLESKDVEVALCFPIIDEKRLKDGTRNGHKYYTFLCDYGAESYNCESGLRMTNRFEEIISDYLPDVIHIWGTEYIHSYSMVMAAENKRMIYRVVVHIQGLVSVYSGYFFQNLPLKVIKQREEGLQSIEDQCRSFINRGEWEKKLIKKIKYVFGRTEWDKANVKLLNKDVHYYHCGEILRKEFYDADAWDFKNVKNKYSVFMTQGTYPIKGAHYAVKAISLLKERFPDILLEIAGEDILGKTPRSAYAEYIDELIEDNGLRNNVQYLGWLSADDLITKYRTSAAYLLPSAIENSPNSLCEAMMVGIPVVASFVGGIPSIIREGEGLLYQYDEPQMLAWQLERVINMDIDRANLSLRERRRANEYNDRDDIIASLTAAYLEIIDNR